VADPRSDGIDADKQSVGIAIDANVGNFQDMPARLALFPKFVAGTGKKDHFAGTTRQFERFGIHKAEHQDVPGGFILNDGGDQAA
jgi:hypothetical protein